MLGSILFELSDISLVTNIGQATAQHLSCDLTFVARGRIRQTKYFFPVYRKPWERVLPILVTLTSHSNSDFKRSNISFNENKPDGVDPIPTVSTIAFERKKKEFHGYRQTVSWKGPASSCTLNFERMLSVRIDDYAKDGGSREV